MAMIPGRLARVLGLIRPRAKDPGRPSSRQRSGDPGRHAPPGSDWVWRPSAFDTPLAAARATGLAPGQPLGGGLAVFHDCPLLDLRLCPVAANETPGTMPGAFAIEVGGFSGSYLSVVVDLPAVAARSMTRQHLVSVHALLGLSGPAEVHVRLNLRHGPNTDSLTRKAPHGAMTGDPAVRIDFDLASAGFETGRIEAAWLDLLVSRPAATRIEWRDVVLSRRLRAML